MSIIALLLLALGVSMDNFAVSLAIGTAEPVRRVKAMVRLALMFGAFQVFMPLLSWLGGFQFAFLFRGRESWILCGVLAFVGWRMLHSAQESEQVRSTPWSLSAPHLVLVLRQALTRWWLALASQ
jgi:putative Mn2+ efflux pump MntP